MATAFPVDDIEYKNLKFHEQIGEGAFGSVNRVTFLQPYKGYNEVAGKTVFKMDEKEVQLMSQLHHRHIVKLVGLSQSGPIHVILMEYAPNGSLHDYLSDASKPLPSELRSKWIKESALAIQYLHDRNYLHRDIKPSNCLLFEDNLLKLCDFGIARKIENSQSTSSQKGTCRYMAPEIHVGNDQGRAVFSKPVDIYAYGMLMLEICTRKPPFQTWVWPKLVFEIGGGAKPTIPTDCSKDLAKIMQSCWEYNPKQRPTIACIIADLEREGDSEDLQTTSVVLKGTTRGPDAEVDGVDDEYMTPEEREHLLIENSIIAIQEPDASSTQRHLDKCYRMATKPTGFCLIIHNDKFYAAEGIEKCKDRVGSEKDVEKLLNCFNKFNFEIILRENLPAHEMYNQFSQVIASPDLKNHDAFVCCILTHGQLGKVAGSNSEYVEIGDIISVFTAENCPHLAGKPKMFFLQSCQGKVEQGLHDIEEDCPRSTMDHGIDDAPMACLALDEQRRYDIETYRQRWPTKVHGIGFGLKETIPNEADFLLGYATVPGYVTYRSRSKGTWYIGALVDALNDNYTEEDILSILTIVNQKLSQNKGWTNRRGEVGQVPAPVTSLRKKVYFHREEIIQYL